LAGGIDFDQMRVTSSRRLPGSALPMG
jgi:hypothetical protein